jgi:acrylyl-CoA reductase (NADPH)
LQKFKALWVEEQLDGTFSQHITEREMEALPNGELLVEVLYSSLNYKDALSARGNKGVTRNYPHTPGIDAVGRVISCATSLFQAGDEVIVTGYDLGMNTAGGFGQLIRVPAAWALPLPGGMSLRESMILGTAGFTAALCVEKLIRMGVGTDHGEVLVTGASGGLGSVAVALLAKLGYHVVASTGKKNQHELLKSLGAESVISREELSEASPKPLLKERWAAAVDVAGGETLSNILKTLKFQGSVASCGLVSSPAFNATVLPFILRGINLLGVDSVNLPITAKQPIWEMLANEWRLDSLDQLVTEIGFDKLISSLNKVSKGESVGRIVLDLKT